LILTYGEVWLARNRLGTLRAIKIVCQRDFPDAGPFEREFHGICKFEPISRAHPALVDLLQVGRHDAEGCYYYVMELADPAGDPKPELREPNEARTPKPEPLLGTAGLAASACGAPSDFGPRTSDFYQPRTLRHDLRTRGRLPFAECVELGLALAGALEHLHQHGLVHRDVKPSNVIFVNGQPKLADIGLVTGIDEARSFVGTEGFVPPEGPGTPQADLYSTGKLLYEATMGRSRLEFPTLPADWDAIPSEEQARLIEFNEVLL
jgi:serine/threonine protein kinase